VPLCLLQGPGPEVVKDQHVPLRELGEDARVGAVGLCQAAGDLSVPGTSGSPLIALELYSSEAILKT